MAGEDSRDIGYDYCVASKTLSYVVNENCKATKRLFNDITVTNTKTFFLILNVCAFARTMKWTKLKNRMFHKLYNRNNLGKLKVYLEAVLRVFCVPGNNNYRLAFSAVNTHFNELYVFTRVMYYCLRIRPKVDNYDKLKAVYESFDEQLSD